MKRFKLKYTSRSHDQPPHLVNGADRGRLVRPCLDPPVFKVMYFGVKGTK